MTNKSLYKFEGLEYTARRGIHTMMQIKRYILPHDGIIRGAHGHKKQIIQRGTRVYCIVYGTLMFHSVYLNEAQALRCLQGLEASTQPGARRYIPFDVMVAWNFKDRFPRKVCRP